MMVYAIFSLISCSQPKEALSGSQVYSLYCVHCHQENGEGVNKRYPPLAGSQWLTGTKPIKIVLHGLQGEIEVRGERYSNVMAPWGYMLSDAEVANVVNYIRSSWGNKVAPTTTKEVQTIRKRYEGRSSWSAIELQQED